MFIIHEEFFLDKCVGDFLSLSKLLMRENIFKFYFIPQFDLFRDIFLNLIFIAALHSIHMINSHFYFYQLSILIKISAKIFYNLPC